MLYKIPISVVMPCFNSEKFIQKAIESILVQNFSDFELIVINDGSTEITEQIIRNFKDPRIKYFSLPVNRGNYPARNLGMKLARGKYIAVMDADDVALPNRLQVQFDYLEKHKKIACVGSSFQLIDKGGIKLGTTIPRPINYQEIKVLLLKDNFVTHPTMLFRCHLVRKKLGYNEKYNFASDFDFIYRVSKNYAVTNLNEVLMNYRIHDQQISSEKKFGQTQFADEIRLKQLIQFDVPISDGEKNIHLKLMKGGYLSDFELSKCEKWFNKLLKANYYKSLYRDDYLFALLQNSLSFAVNKNKLGGWSVEKALINHLKEKFQGAVSILEFGSGNGTEALLANYNVTSIEHNPVFCIQRGENHTCLLAPIQGNWYERETVQKTLLRSYDLILIDGPPGELREGILKNIDLFKGISCPIIFDDINRERDKKILTYFCNELGLSYQIFNGQQKQFGIVMK